MPAYSNAQPPNSISPGDVFPVWGSFSTPADGKAPVLGGGESPAIGTGGVSASARVALATAVSQSSSVHFDGQFSGAPGAFEVDFQVADVDADSFYQTMQNMNVTTVDATNNTFHGEAITDARFARLLMRARANAVSVVATIGR